MAFTQSRVFLMEGVGLARRPEASFIDQVSTILTQYSTGSSRRAARGPAPMVDSKRGHLPI